jgi:hypothetical protein
VDYYPCYVGRLIPPPVLCCAERRRVVLSVAMHGLVKIIYVKLYSQRYYLCYVGRYYPPPSL